MPFVDINSPDENTTLDKVPAGSLFVFEDELVAFSYVKIKTDEKDEDGDPKYVWLEDGTLGVRSYNTPVIVVKLPVGTPTRA